MVSKLIGIIFILLSMSDIQVLDNRLQLSSNLVNNMLKAHSGDRIAINFAERDGHLVPTISVSNCGNKLSCKGTISFRGAQKDLLIQYGTTFEAEVSDSGIIYLKGDNPEFKVFTSVKKAVEHTLDKEIILDTNFDLKHFNYEL